MQERFAIALFRYRHSLRLGGQHGEEGSHEGKDEVGGEEACGQEDNGREEEARQEEVRSRVGARASARRCVTSRGPTIRLGGIRKAAAKDVAGSSRRRRASAKPRIKPSCHPGVAAGQWGRPASRACGVFRRPQAAAPQTTGHRIVTKLSGLSRVLFCPAGGNACPPNGGHPRTFADALGICGNRPERAWWNGAPAPCFPRFRSLPARSSTDDRGRLGVNLRMGFRPAGRAC